MTAELGHFCLNLALAMAILQFLVPLYGAYRNDQRLMAVGDAAAQLQLALVTGAFGALTYAFVTSDFSLALVAGNSHSLKPLLYKFAGVWGNHEGSLLLWVLSLCVFTATAVWFGGALPQRLKARVIAVQGAIGVAFLLFMLLTSNPFWRLVIPPLEGADLNPLLQDPGLAFHPPFLYLGYVGLSMSFSFAIAALLEGRVDAAWGRWVRPWALGAWMLLTIGIILGSWWAYYELGWGGFWFWDPVENASFIPWLFATALLHSALVVEKRDSLKAWTILLAILAFGFSLIGTFIVRSGVITSVHAFANDPERGVFILMILAVFMGGALFLFALRAGAMEAKGLFAPVSREGALVANNLLLAVSALVVFIGTIWPLVAEMAFDRKLSVGPPFFNAAFTPFMVLLGLLLPLGSVQPWKRGNLTKAARMMRLAGAMAILAMVLAFALQGTSALLGPLGLGLGLWVLFGAVADIWSRTGRATGRWGRLFRLPLADWGKFFAHAGVGLFILAAAGITAWTIEDIRVAKPGDTFSVGDYELTLIRVGTVQGPNYTSQMAEVQVTTAQGAKDVLFPEKRFYPAAGMPTTEAAIGYGLYRDIYVVIGEAQGDGSYALRSYVKPLASWLWLGAAMMAFGGLLSLMDRRYRLAAGARPTPPQPAE